VRCAVERKREYVQEAWEMKLSREICGSHDDHRLLL
jgi:hypothetical protein